MWDTAHFAALLRTRHFHTVFHHCRSMGVPIENSPAWLAPSPHFVNWKCVAKTIMVMNRWDLCRAMVFHVAAYVQPQGATCAAPSFAKQEIDTDFPSHRVHLTPPWLTAFGEVFQWPANTPLPPLSRKLSALFWGDIASGDADQVFQQPAELPQQDLVGVGPLKGLSTKIFILDIQLKSTHCSPVASIKLWIKPCQCLMNR